VLEANHDLKLLQEDLKRPWSVKQRILSRHGHLSNEAAASVATQIVSADLRHLYLGHLSGDCNRPELAHRAVSGALEAMGATHVRIEATAPDVACATLAFDAWSSAAPEPSTEAALALKMMNEEWAFQPPLFHLIPTVPVSPPTSAPL
jgi:hypothetical protein